MVAYKGFGERPDIQAKIAMMVRKSLDRMLDVAPSGKCRGFDRKTDWDVWCEGHSGWGYVDQELGQAHLFFSLYLYGEIR